MAKELRGELSGDESEDEDGDEVKLNESDEGFETAAAMEQIVENVLQEESGNESSDRITEITGEELEKHNVEEKEVENGGEEGSKKEGDGVEDEPVELVAKPKKKQKSIFKPSDDGFYE